MSQDRIVPRGRGGEAQNDLRHGQTDEEGRPVLRPWWVVPFTVLGTALWIALFVWIL